jgi:Polyketide cyclase / dehydrase and lipid transport
MSKSHWIAIGVAACVATTAQAVEVRKRVDNIKGTQDKVWEKIGAFCAIKDWHPSVVDCEETKEGDVIRRFLTLKDGGKVKERLVARGTQSYSYVIEESPFPVKNYSATFQVGPDRDDDDESEVVWTAQFDANGKSDTEAAAIMQGVIDAGVKKIKQQFKDAARK